MTWDLEVLSSSLTIGCLSMDDEQGTNDLATPTLMRSARGVSRGPSERNFTPLELTTCRGTAPSSWREWTATAGPYRTCPQTWALASKRRSSLWTSSRGGATSSAAPARTTPPAPGVTELTELTELTERGTEVVQAVRRGIEAVDLRLRKRVAPEQIDAMRSVLIALTEIKSQGPGAEGGRPGPSRQFHQISPIFSVRDLKAALAHYAALGFDTIPYEDGDGYGFANRDGLGLHLAVHDDHDHTHCGSAYLYVRDADKLYEEWSRPGVGGHTHPAGPTPYKFREGSHTDPDGNLIRFGSPMEE